MDIRDNVRAALKLTLDAAEEWKSRALDLYKTRHTEVSGDHRDEALIESGADLHAARLCITALTRELVALGGKITDGA